MGLISEAGAQLAAAVTESKLGSIASTVPAFVSGQPQTLNTRSGYGEFALEGYAKNEIVFAATEELATSAAEPGFIAEDLAGEPLDRHRASDLINSPNPFSDRFDLIANVIMHLALGGNAYVEIELSGAREPIGLWNLRPDRMQVIPDRDRFIRGYKYQIGNEAFFIEAERVIHFRSRHPLNDYYGMPPLMAAAGRIDLDNWMRDFVRAFFTNAGVPSGLLAFKKSLDDQERATVRRRFRSDTGGPAGWHNVLIVDADEGVTYTEMGRDPNELAMPQLDEVSEARIAMVLGVPQSIIGTRLGNQSAAYANRRADQENFWRNTLVPKYSSIGATFTRSLRPFYTDLGAVRADLSDVQALQEDRDKLHERWRADYSGGLVSLEEARGELGLEPEVDPDHTFLVPVAQVPTRGAELVDDGEEDAAPPAPEPPEPDEPATP